MRRVVIRLFALIVIASQVVQVGGAALCSLDGRHHVRHCDDAMQQVAGPAVGAPAQDLASAFCALMGPCTTPVPAVTSVAVASYATPDASSAVMPVRATPLRSFNPVPIPPPPQG